ncbi:hypothetical protein GOV03_00880 [Candidatus Woesearchaeota archaeon]|nr:hypothetical protein [Candidatus Woesearchaeota archaeon]
MNSKQFYENLRTDRERVQIVVDELKAGGFEVYATGSTLKHSDYNDIDLVVKPQEGMTSGDIENQLEKAIGSSKEQETSNKLVLLLMADVDSVLMAEFDEPFKEYSPLDKYGDSQVIIRQELNIGGTKIDLLVTYKPFELDPRTDYVRL